MMPISQEKEEGGKETEKARCGENTEQLKDPAADMSVATLKGKIWAFTGAHLNSGIHQSEEAVQTANVEWTSLIMLMRTVVSLSTGFAALNSAHKNLRIPADVLALLPNAKFMDQKCESPESCHSAHHLGSFSYFIKLLHKHTFLLHSVLKVSLSQSPKM